MRRIKFSCCAVIALFIFSIVAFATVHAEDAGFTDYVINQDGSVAPDTSAITHIGTNYFLTQDITGTVIIQKDDAVFDGAGYTLKGNAVKGAYDLSESVLYLDAGFNLTRAWNVTVQNVKIENCVNGITLLNSYYCRILNCSISESTVDGMKIAWSSYNMVFWNNFISNTDDGIQLINAENNRVMVNNMDSGAEHRTDGNGFQLNGNCSYNMIEGNNVNSFDTGIIVDASNGVANSNLFSYNNFTDNSWNGVVIGGMGNVVTLNNFYNNGMLSVGDNNCSGNYWSTNSSIYDNSPLAVPINSNVTPENIHIPRLEPKPTPTTTPTPILTVAPTPTGISPASTPTPSASTSVTTPPQSSSVPTPNVKPMQSSSIWPIPLLLAVTVSIASLAFAFALLKKQKKDRNKWVLENA